MSIEMAARLAAGPAVVERVAALAPRFRERVPVTEAQRSVPRQSVDELLDAGVARLLVPTEHGGSDARLRDLLDATEAAARGCPSTGWITNLMAHSPQVVGLFPAEGQDAVWKDGPDVVICGSVAPSGRATPVPGGYRITGRHAFTSGVDNADWVFLGGMVPAEAGPPEWRLFLVEKSDYTVDDVWHTAAMRGTGSNTVVVDDVFVPAGYTLSQADAREGTGPGAALNADAKFGLPWVAYATLGFTATMLGAAQAAYDHACAAIAAKRLPAGKRAAEGQIVQVEVAFAAARIATARKLLIEIAERADAGSAYTLGDRIVIGRDNTFVAMLLTEAVDTLLELSGTSAFGTSNPVQQVWRDVHFAAAHTSVNKTESGTRFGRLALGVEETEVGFF